MQLVQDEGDDGGERERGSREKRCECEGWAKKSESMTPGPSLRRSPGESSRCSVPLRPRFPSSTALALTTAIRFLSNAPPPTRTPLLVPVVLLRGPETIARYGRYASPWRHSFLTWFGRLPAAVKIPRSSALSGSDAIARGGCTSSCVRRPRKQMGWPPG